MDFIWSIDQLERRIGDGAVVVAHWRCTATVGEWQSAAIGRLSFTPDPGASGFVPFEALTEKIVVGWVRGALGAEAIAAREAGLEASINALRTPAVVPGLPWAAPASEPATAE